MPPEIAARAALSAVLFTAAAATAVAETSQPRSVAIVDVSAESDASTEEIAKLRDTLPAVDLRPIEDKKMRASLEGGPAKRIDHRAAALGALKRARGAFADFAVRAAATNLIEAQRHATSIWISDRRTAASVLSEIHLLWGRVHEADGKTSAALDNFRAASRLNPERRTLDPANYKPSLVDLYASASKSARAGRAELRLTGDKGAKVMIDGRDVGTLPKRVTDLAPGTHYVVTRAANRITDARAVVLGRKPLEVRVELAAEDKPRQLLRLRARVADNPKTIEPADLRGIAIAASVDVVIVVRDGDDGLEAAAFNAKTEKLGQWTSPSALAFRAGRAAANAPAASSTVADPRLGADKSPDDDDGRPWYLGWKGAAAAGAVVVVVTVAALLLIPDETSFSVGGVVPEVRGSR